MEAENQSAPLLRTKLHRPPVTSGLIARDRLLRLLDRSLEVPLTLVSAPAGYGKSVLVSQWIEQLDRPAAWISLDEDDSDLRTFLEYFLVGVGGVSSGACRATRDLLQAPEPAPVEVIAGNLLNDLDDIDEPLLVVLDDYHHLDAASPVHELTRRLLQHPPRDVHVVLTMRRDPPLPLASLRAAGRVAEVRLRDLRFTTQETAELLAAGASMPLAEDALANLEREVEGWAAGLRLVSLALRHADNPDAFLEGLHGGIAQTQEYLLHEVLAGRPSEERDCLLQLSILDRFCADLIDALCVPTAHAEALPPSGRDVVDRLVQGGLFTIALDSQDEWVRYHHLFRDLLRRQLETTASSEQIATLHRRASDWFESRGLITEALVHALAAEEEVRAAEIVESHTEEEFEADRWYLVERWLEMLPAGIRQERPALLLAEASVAYCRLQLERLPALLERAAALLDEQTAPPRLSGELAFFEGNLLYWEGEAESSREHLEAAVPRLGETSGRVLGEAELSLALARCATGQAEVAIQALEKRLRDYDPARSYARTRFAAGLVFVHLLCGDLPRARMAAARLRQEAERGGLANAGAWASYLAGCGRLHALELDAAAHEFRRAVEQRYVLETRAALDAFAGLALAQQLLDQHEEAATTVGRLVTFAGEMKDPQCMPVAHSCRARLAVLRGDLDDVFGAAQPLPEPTPGGLLTWLEVPEITRARALIAGGTAESLRQAVELLETIREASERWRFVNQTIEVAVLRAVALRAQGHADDALAGLDGALVLAQPGGSMRPFVEAGAPVAELLAELHRRTDETGFIERLLAAFDDGAEAPARSPRPSPSETGAARPAAAGLLAPDALTNRELDVLELLSGRLQNKEIADKLCISTHTVNDHLKRLYQKLGVRNRRRAVERGIEIGLLTRE